MEIFEYVAVLTSIIIGLAMAHLLQGIAGLIQQPEQNRVYWIHLAWVLNMFFFNVFWWWWEFNLGLVEMWTFQLYMFVILYAVSLYLLCALLFPRSLADSDGFEGYFYAHRYWFFGLFAFVHIIDLGDSWLKGAEYFAGLGPEYLVAQPLKIVLGVAAMLISNKKFHAVFAVSFLLYQLSWALRQFGAIA